ncbi:MAG: GIY-YIG nuclease family protein [Candidatus Dojkabacteria bacterium]|nr:MAG: GIY-YIG nuclease family protein [Candidatus Dojkabacteria bacterium]
MLKSIKPRRYPFYIGVTSNLLLRLNQHNSLLNRGYTKKHRWELVYVEGYMIMLAAYDREKKLKQHGNVWYAAMKRVK